MTARFVVPSRYLRKPEKAEVEMEFANSNGKPEQAKPLADGASVLLVEDNIIIAMDAENMLQTIGFSEVLMSSTVSGALKILDEKLPTAAVLDINLGDEVSIPIAESLAKAGIPFIFASGYGDAGGLPEIFADTPVVTKPYTVENLRSVVGYLGGM